jgi:Beta-ketoacyl synthase, N-terminal domain
VQVFIDGVGLRGPGLLGWAAGRDVLAGDKPYSASPIDLPPSPLLPANERRRTVATVRLALLVGAEAFANAKRDPAVTATVFASSGGDGETIHHIFEALASADPEVSPTRFHNSLHNTPSGYWSIATKSRAPSTSLGAFDVSFAAGLLDAAAQATVEGQAVALVSYDLPYPEPLHNKRPIGSVFGVSLVLAPKPSAASFARLTVTLDPARAVPTKMDDPALEAMRSGNPAARSLPLLEALASGRCADIALGYLRGNALAVSVAPMVRP